ncbi:MAG: hypothetical protein ACK5U7_16320 [Bacteroidota bacterium]|jgi:hypothetical protein
MHTAKELEQAYFHLCNKVSAQDLPLLRILFDQANWALALKGLPVSPNATGEKHDPTTGGYAHPRPL